MSAIFPGAPSNLIGAATGSVSIEPGVFLEGATISANAASFPTISFPAYGSLDIRLNILGFSASDIVAVRFNSDSGTNYWDRNMTAVAASVVFVDNPTASTTLIRVGIAGTKSITAKLFVGNNLGVSKLVSGAVSMGTGAAATPGTAVVSMAGEWVNTAAQITSLTVLCVGANNLLAGSSIAVYGGL